MPYYLMWIENNAIAFIKCKTKKELDENVEWRKKRYPQKSMVVIKGGMEKNHLS